MRERIQKLIVVFCWACTVCMKGYTQERYVHKLVTDYGTRL